MQEQFKQTLFYEKNKSLFKRADLGKYIGIENIKHNLKDFPSHYTRPRSDLVGGDLTALLGRAKSTHDIFITLDGFIETAVQSKKPKAVALVKWLNKRGIEKIQEEHQQAITGCDNQIEALEVTNEEHQQEILRFNEEINDLKANMHVANRGCFDNLLCFIKSNSKEVHPYYVI